MLREAVVMGMPRTRRPWKKILVVVEGIYSMEGEVADLKPIVEVAKRHKVRGYSAYALRSTRSIVFIVKTSDMLVAH